jgi:hypothetical protein
VSRDLRKKGTGKKGTFLKGVIREKGDRSLFLIFFLYKKRDLSPFS